MGARPGRSTALCAVVSTATHALVLTLVWRVPARLREPAPSPLALVDVTLIESPAGLATAGDPESAIARSRSGGTTARRPRARDIEAAAASGAGSAGATETPALDRLRLTLPGLAPDPLAPHESWSSGGGAPEPTRLGPRIPHVPRPGLLELTQPEPPVDHSRFTKKLLPDGRVQLDERPRVETLRERQNYIRETATNRAHTAIDETSHGVPWLWGGEPTTTREGDRIDYQGKKRYLEETFAERMLTAGATRASDEQVALAQLPARLEALWRDPTRPVTQRRRLLFDLWAECDPARASGRAARARIEAFVRERLPPASPPAFSPDELAELNRGRHERFEPYR